MIQKFNQYNESLRDKMVPVSDEKIKKSLSELSILDWVRQVLNRRLPDMLPTKEEIKINLLRDYDKFFSMVRQLSDLSLFAYRELGGSGIYLRDIRITDIFTDDEIKNILLTQYDNKLDRSFFHHMKGYYWQKYFTEDEIMKNINKLPIIDYNYVIDLYKMDLDKKYLPKEELDKLIDDNKHDKTEIEKTLLNQFGIDITDPKYINKDVIYNDIQKKKKN